MARTSQAKRKLSTTNQPLGGSIKRAKSGQEEQPPSPESLGSKNTELNTDDVEAKGNEGKTVEAAKSEHKDSPQGKAMFYLWADALMEWIDDSPEELVFRLKSAVLEEWSRVQAASNDLSEEDKQDLIAEAASKVDQWYVEELGREDDERSELANKLVEIAEAIMKEESSKEKAKKGEDKDADEDDEEANDGWWWELQLQREQPKDGVPAIEVKLFEGRGKEGDPESYNGRWWWTGVSPADEVGSKALSSMIDYLAARLV